MPDEHSFESVHALPCVSRQWPACGAQQNPPCVLQSGSSQQKLLMHLLSPHAASLAHGSPIDSIGKQLPGLDDVSKYPALTAELLKRGYSDADIRKILGENVMRVFREAEKVSKRLQTERGPSTAIMK